MIKKTFIPDAADQTGSGVKRAVRASFPSIILKLAQNKGFNSSMNIRSSSGDFIPGTDVGALTMLACENQKYVPGKKSFAALLSSSGVDASEVANESIRMRMTTGTTSRPPSPPPDFSTSPPSLPPPSPPPRPPSPLETSLPRPPPLAGPFQTNDRPYRKPRRQNIRAVSKPLAPHELPLPEDITAISTPNVQTKRASSEERGAKKKVYEAYDSDDNDDD